MYHARDGLYFQQLEDGAVQILKMQDAKPNSPIIMDVILDKDTWASIIATMSYYGEEDYGYYRALNFHTGVEIPESCPLKDKRPSKSVS